MSANTNANTEQHPGLLAEIDCLKHRIAVMQNELNMRHAKDTGDVWYWQGDGTDNPDSMVNSLAVVISAADLRAHAAGLRAAFARNAEKTGPVFANDGREPDWSAYAAAESAAEKSDEGSCYDPEGYPPLAPRPKDICAEMRALCQSCGGTGDVHRADGEWMGECTCPAGVSTALERLKISALRTHEENEKLRAALAKCDATVATDLLYKLVKGEVGKQTLWRLSDGIGTDTDEGRAWLKAKEFAAAIDRAAQAAPAEKGGAA